MSGAIGSSVAIGVISALILLIGWRRGFFIFQNPSDPWQVPIKILHLIGAFSIYFFGTLLSTSFFVYLSKKEILTNVISLSTWFNFGASSLIFLSLVLYLILLPQKIRRGILRRDSEKNRPFTDDIWFAIFAWLLAFPLVLFVGQALEQIVYSVFHVTQLPDQIAVKFLKMTFQYPLYLALSTLSIVLLAPLIEETLFRGFLQTYIRQHLGKKQAILITAVCFSLFHYSSDQGLGNIPIIGSLFILALFLGFLYERQGSLLAPITLHASFNGISVLNLYFLGGFTSGI